MINIQTAAERYISGKHQEPTKLELAIFAEWLDRSFAEIESAVRFTAAEVSPSEMLARLEETGELLISCAHNDSIWLTPEQNQNFRAVHDSHHVRYGLSFDAQGEYMAFEAAAAEAPPELHWILRSEIWLQAAASIHTGAFQEQKLVNY